MTFSLHAATVPSGLQIIGAMEGILDKAEAFCAERGIAPETLIQARLTDDMLPFAYQVKSVAVHSLGAIEGVRRGTFSPDRTEPPADFAGLRARTVETREALAAIDPAEIDGFIGRDMVFEIGERRVPFAAEDFLLSFSMPNFYFHAATAYDILRGQGVDLGKRDFLGRLRTR